MTYTIGEMVTVPDALSGDDVPAIVTAVNEDGTVNVTVFGSSDVIEKRSSVDLSPETDEDDATEDPAESETVTATGKRRSTAPAFTESGE